MSVEPWSRGAGLPTRGVAWRPLRRGAPHLTWGLPGGPYGWQRGRGGTAVWGEKGATPRAAAWGAARMGGRLTSGDPTEL
jgi:hypothetical protein